MSAAYNIVPPFPQRREVNFSPDRVYRYQLKITWHAGLHVNFLMLNPSTADEIRNDPTVERCERRSRKWGYGGLIVTNIFAIRSTDPRVIRTAADPVGSDNDAAIAQAAGESSLIVCAWGNDGLYRNRSEAVRRLLAGYDLMCLKRNVATGEPAHPLYIGYDVTPQPLEPHA